MKVPTYRLVLAVAAVLALITSDTRAQNDASFAPGKARTHAGTQARPLTGRSNAAPIAVIAQYLRGLGRNVDVRSLVANGGGASGDGVSVRVEQRVGGVRLYGAYARASLSNEGELLHLIENLFFESVGAVGRPRISESDALAATLRYLYPDEAIQTGAGRRQGDTVRFDRTPFFHDEPTVTRVVYPAADGSFGAGFLVHTWTEEQNLLHETLIGAAGEVLFDELRTNSDSYAIFPVSPKVTSVQTTAVGPGAGNAQSPQGWLFAGNQNSIHIRGNNVSAYLDAVANNAADSGGTTISDGHFLAGAELSSSPSTATNRAVAVQNLFYLNNLLHDTLRANGFVESEGNFQEDNFGLGGLGSDSVNAEAQDGSGTDNANFATPSDGSNPRMQMYLWNGGPDHEVVVNGASYKALRAAFGPALGTTGISGPLANASPADACSAVANLAGKVAIVDRGTCDFVVKVQNAQNAGAIAVIVANTNQDPDAVIAMGGNSKKIRIPSVMVSFNSGDILHDLAGSNALVRQLSTTPIMIDADLDFDIVAHEYGHGLTWRMIGGMSGPFAGALGEGAGDTLAMLMTRPLDGDGADAIGEYSALNSNGIRRFRYRDYPADMTYSDVAGASVHDDGEIYAAIMWELLEKFEAAGKTAGDVLNLFVQGMRYTPSTPAFEDMRNGMLQAASLTPTAAADCALIWDAFADRGVGVDARGTISRRRLTIVEDFDAGVGCTP
jgi:extracellular elastinolytic metalloproteinase